jgi:hypothetical protein
MRIAMWSGPRNLSTAMMYAFASRADFAVWDEPFYAPYLKATGADHPLRDEILARHETDPQIVEAQCLGPVPDGKPHFYMKHMPHHMLEGFPLNWSASCVNVHLIRHPARVIASYGAKRSDISADDIGFRQQLAVYRQLGGIVIDSADIRADPRAAMTHLCAAIGLPFDPAMLAWREGGIAQDGAWAPHWYGAVHRSTGFAGAEAPLPTLDGSAAVLMRDAMPFYEEMAKRRISLT